MMTSNSVYQYIAIKCLYQTTQKSSIEPLVNPEFIHPTSGDLTVMTKPSLLQTFLALTFPAGPGSFGFDLMCHQLMP